MLQTMRIMALVLLTACSGLHVARPSNGEARTSGAGGPPGKHYVLTSYGLHDTVRATVGSPVVSVRTGFRYATTEAHLWREDVLSYSGMSGTLLRIGYRAWTSDAPGAVEELALEYDLAKSRIIKFKVFTFEVLDATDSELTIQVLEDGGLAQAAGHPGAPAKPPSQHVPPEPSLTL